MKLTLYICTLIISLLANPPIYGQEANKGERSKDISIFDKELLRLRGKAQETISDNVQEFNNYEGRPDSDGIYNSENNEALLQANIPYFLSSNKDFTEVFNYRWWMMSKHLRSWTDPDTNEETWVITEFYGWPGHGSLSGAIPCPAGHQFYDMRWFRDTKYLRSYIDFYMQGYASKHNQREPILSNKSRPESHHFSSWMVDGTEAFLKIHPDTEWRNQILPYLEKHQQVWGNKFMVNKPGSKTDGLYKVLDVYDGMEFTISASMALIASDGPYSMYTEEEWRDYYLGWQAIGNSSSLDVVKAHPDAFAGGYPLMYLARPSINSYYYANFKSLSNLYALKATESGDKKDRSKSLAYKIKAEELQKKTLSTLWSEEDQFFNSCTAADNNYGVKDWEAHIRESAGYTPWYFNMIPKSSKKYSVAWDLFSSTKGFNNNNGMTTAEQQSPYYDEQAYAWNGRGWPFQNSVVYKAYANYLRNYKEEITLSDKELLYDNIEKLVNMHGEERNIGEWYIPSDGEEFGGVKDYFHSTFPDIIIEDLLGFKSSHEDKFSLQPLLPKDKWDYFYLGKLSYHKHDIDIIWRKDWDPDKQGNQSALCIWVDGKLVSKSKDLNSLIEVKLK